MQKSEVREFLEQLLQVYVYAEQQYVFATIDSVAPLLHIFFRKRAFERSEFILQIRYQINSISSEDSVQQTIEEFFSWHDSIYCNATLINWPITNINTVIIDEKALEICTRFLNESLPPEIHRIIEHHAISIESSLLSFAYLKALHKNNEL